LHDALPIFVLGDFLIELSLICSCVYLLEFNNSLMSISNKAAICNKVSRLGCTSFVHQRDTVVSFLSNCSASHLLVLPCSTSTTFNLFIGFLGIIICVSCKYTYFK